MYSIGDYLICRVNTSKTDTIPTVIFDIDFNDPKYQQFSTRNYLVIGYWGNYYILNVPNEITNAELLTQSRIDRWKKDDPTIKNIDPKFIGESYFLIKDNSVGGRVKFDPYSKPLKCKICFEYVSWAVPNQDDGGFICWVCRNTRLIK